MEYAQSVVTYFLFRRLSMKIWFTENCSTSMGIECIHFVVFVIISTEFQWDLWNMLHQISIMPSLSWAIAQIQRTTHWDSHNLTVEFRFENVNGKYHTMYKESVMCAHNDSCHAAENFLRDELNEKKKEDFFYRRVFSRVHLLSTLVF